MNEIVKFGSCYYFANYLLDFMMSYRIILLGLHYRHIQLNSFTSMIKFKAFDLFILIHERITYSGFHSKYFLIFHR